MRDFKPFVRERVATLGLPPDREQKIVDEWAAALEDTYDGLRADGLTDEEAWREIQRQVPDGKALDLEPMLLPPTSAQPEPLPRRTIRAALTTLRHALTRGVARDVVASVRLFVREPGFNLTVVLTLAICLGANAAIFTVVHSVLLRPLPAPESDRIVGIGDVFQPSRPTTSCRTTLRRTSTGAKR
jgi:hypothetical protein